MTLAKPQPHSDKQIASMCFWLIRNQYTCHVSKAGDMVLRKRTPRPEDTQSSYRQSILKRAFGVEKPDGAM